MGVLAHTSSPYNTSIDVIKRFWTKELYVNGIQQSGAYTTQLWKKGLVNTPQNPVKRILVLGIGGGTVFRMLRKKYPQAAITAVDIDQEIITLYKKYFSQDTHETLICSDARMFIKKEKSKFDLIIVDVYIGNDVPEFVGKKEFFQSIEKRLQKNGCMILNYFSYYDQPEKSKKIDRILKTIFPWVEMKSVLRNVFYYCGKIRGRCLTS